MSWQLPTWIESMVLVGALGAPRRRAEPDPADLPRARGRLRRPPGGRQAARRPAVWRGFDFEAMARRASEPTPTVSRCCIAANLLDGDVDALPAVPAAAEPFAPGVRPTAAALALLHVGHDRRPEGRAPHRQHGRRAPAYAMVDAFDLTADDRNALVFPFTHIGGISWLFAGLMTGCAQRDHRGLRPGDHDPVLERERRHARRRGHRRSTWPTSPRSAAGRPPAVPRDAHLPRRRRGQAAAAPLRREGAARRRSASSRATASPSARSSSMCRRRRRPTSRWPTPRARRAPASSVKVVTLDGNVAGRGEEGEIRVKGPKLMPRLPRLVARRRRLRRGRLLPHRRPRLVRRRRPRGDHRPAQGHHHPQGREHLGQGGRGPPLHAPEGRRRRGDRPARRRVGRAGVRDRGGRRPGRPADAAGAVRLPARPRASWRRRSPSSSRSSTCCRATRPARCSSTSCASSTRE